MKTRPILFSTDMVKAILEGRKTQTRRIIKPQPTDIWIEDCRNQSPDLSMFDKKGKQIFWIENSVKNGEVKPKAEPGDVFWVRETWVRLHEAYLQKLDPDPESPHFFYWHKADGKPAHWEHYNEKWKPSIHMPKEACRLFLKVTNVRVERLQDISEEDAIAEGIIKHSDFGKTGYKLYTEPNNAYTDIDAKESFFSLWESINGKESLDYNPWVWVYDFERIERVELFNLQMEAINGVML